jgi:hypothetical protein
MIDLKAVEHRAIDLSPDGGAFTIRSPTDGGTLRIIASHGEGWDHISVSRTNRPPNHREMEAVLAVFAKEDETWMQLHVPATEHINIHPHCLHWWRPQNQTIPRPPPELV